MTTPSRLALQGGAVVGAVFLCTLCGCTEPEVEPKPEAPSMTQTLRSFDAPGADLTPDNVAEAINTLIERNTVLELLGIEAQVLDTLGDVDSAESDGQQKAGAQKAGELRTVEQPIELGNEGFIRVSRICNGWGDEPSPDPSHGVMRLVVPFTDTRLDPVVWAFFDNCQFVNNGTELLIGRGSEGKIGDLRFSAGNNTALSDLTSVPLTFELDLAYTTIDNDGIRDTKAAQLEFRIDPSSGGVPEILLPVNGGALVAQFGGTGVFIRAANGDWNCDLEVGQCNAGDESFSF